MTQEWDKVRQNLADAGCPDSFVATYPLCAGTGGNYWEKSMTNRKNWTAWII